MVKYVDNDDRVEDALFNALHGMLGDDKRERYNHPWNMLLIVRLDNMRTSYRKSYRILLDMINDRFLDSQKPLDIITMCILQANNDDPLPGIRTKLKEGGWNVQIRT